jgi:chromosome segregation ATPase
VNARAGECAALRGELKGVVQELLWKDANLTTLAARAALGERRAGDLEAELRVAGADKARALERAANVTRQLEAAEAEAAGLRAQVLARVAQASEQAARLGVLEEERRVLQEQLKEAGREAEVAAGTLAGVLAERDGLKEAVAAAAALEREREVALEREVERAREQEVERARAAQWEKERAEAAAVAEAEAQAQAQARAEGQEGEGEGEREEKQQQAPHHPPSSSAVVVDPRHVAPGAAPGATKPCRVGTQSKGWCWWGLF